MIIRDVIAALEDFAPLPLQDDYDNSGLQIGTTESEVSGALLCLDVTPQVIAQASDMGYNLVISHHPVLFHPLKKIIDNDFTSDVVRQAIVNGMTIYSAHTSLDNAPQGVSMHMASLLGLENVQVLAPRTDFPNAGSGVIGNFPYPVTEEHLLATVRYRFGTPCIRHNGQLERKISRVALCGGSGAFLIDRALEQGADAFLTGEISYHRYFGYDGRIKLIETGHYESEQYTVDLLFNYLSGKFPQLKLSRTQVRTNPVNYYI